MAPKQWLSDPKQLDDKRSDHPAREFGHERIIFHMDYQPGHVESDMETIRRLMEGLQRGGTGSFASAVHQGRYFRVERREEGFYMIIKQDGEIVQEGTI